MMHKSFVWLACTCILATGLTRAGQSDDRITPNFHDADILQVIEAVRPATGRTFIIDPRVRATVTMLSSTPMTPTQFYEAFHRSSRYTTSSPSAAAILSRSCLATTSRMLPGNDLSDRVNSSFG